LGAVKDLRLDFRVDDFRVDSNSEGGPDIFQLESTQLHLPYLYLSSCDIFAQKMYFSPLF
jgi:hypothetical protein